MRKFAVLLLGLLVSGCWNTNMKMFDLFPERKSWVENFSSYPIHFFSGKPELVKTEYVEEKNVKPNVALQAYVGATVVSNKTYQINYYREQLLKANMDGMMNSASVPDIVRADKPMKIIGTVVIDGMEYRLVPTSLKDFVFLVKPDGELYDEIGQIRNGDRLVILEATFVPTPYELRLYPVQTSKMEQTKPIKGYDIKYDGVRDRKIWFTFMDYQAASGNGGAFENISFPLKDSVVTINGIRIKVLNANNQKLDYMILP